MSSEVQSATGWIERLSVSNVLIALPVAHLLVASLYTWAWLAGFGANVSVLADPRDLFSVSISRLVNVYLIGLVLPAAQTIWMKRRFSHIPSTINGTAPPPSHNFKAAEYALMAVICLLISLSCILTYDLFQRGQSQGLALLIAANLIGMVCFKFALDHTRLSGDSYRVVNVGVGLLFASVGFGLFDGNSARYFDHETYESRLIRCGDYLVQRRFGENYIALARDDSKVVLDLECKPIMTIPAVKGEASREWHWKPYPHFHYVGEGQAPPHAPKAAPTGHASPSSSAGQ